MRAAARETRRDETGFSLIELMVVALIISILIAIAVPTFMGARNAASDRATQSNVRNAFTATRIFYNENLRYPDAPTDMSTLESSLTWVDTPLTSTNVDRTVRIEVFDVPEDNQTVVVTGRTRSGRCFYLRDVMGGATAGTYYQRDVTGGVSCPAVAPAVITGSSWNA